MSPSRQEHRDVGRRSFHGWRLFCSTKTERSASRHATAMSVRYFSSACRSRSNRRRSWNWSRSSEKHRDITDGLSILWWVPEWSWFFRIQRNQTPMKPMDLRTWLLSATILHVFDHCLWPLTKIVYIVQLDRQIWPQHSRNYSELVSLS